jgi:formiminotetrahydrofolate cyclodeaminase
MVKSTDNFPAKLIYQPVAGFIEQVASKAPAPGGGSVAAYSGALGAALLTMVANLTIGKKKYADVAAEFTELKKQTEELRAQLTAQVDADNDAFKKFRVAGRLPEDAAGREKQLAEASQLTIDVPAKTMQLCLAALKLAPAVAGRGNVNTVSDAATGAEMLLAGLEGAANNVLINIQGRDDADAKRLRELVASVRAEGRKLLEQTRNIVDGKLSA